MGEEKRTGVIDKREVRKRREEEGARWEGGKDGE